MAGDERKRRVSNNATQLFEEAQRAGEDKLRNFLRPYIGRARGMGWRPYFAVEPELILANGEQVMTRAVTIRLVPETAKAKAFCRENKATAIQATDRYVEMQDAEECIANVFGEVLDLAKGAK